MSSRSPRSPAHAHLPKSSAYFPQDTTLNQNQGFPFRVSRQRPSARRETVPGQPINATLEAPPPKTPVFSGYEFREAWLSPAQAEVGEELESSLTLSAGEWERIGLGADKMLTSNPEPCRLPAAGVQPIRVRGTSFSACEWVPATEVVVVGQVR